MVEPFIQHTGVAAVIMRDNVDTDQIIPSREMKSVSRTGLGDGLFAGWRYLDAEARTINPDFVLNRDNQAGSSILISGENFGCGSSREHAVWALKEYGIRAVIAKSFGEIFRGNCVRNGILPIIQPSETIEILATLVPPATLSIDLAKQTISAPSVGLQGKSFEIGQFAKRLLIEGLDPIALTLTESDKIDAFLQQDAELRPWVYSAA